MIRILHVFGEPFLGMIRYLFFMTLFSLFIVLDGNLDLRFLGALRFVSYSLLLPKMETQRSDKWLLLQQVFPILVVDIIPDKVKELVGVGSSRPRFRKRDKVLFYGRKMLRKVKTISGQVHQSKKRKLFLKFARKLLQIRKDTSDLQLKVRVLFIDSAYSI